MPQECDTSSGEEMKQHKLKRLERFRKSLFRIADYAAPSVEWDHDHCEAYWAKFAEFDSPEVLHRGYYTIFQISGETAEVPPFIQQARESGRTVMKKPDNKYWVCQGCFEEFRKALNWKLEPAT